MLGLPSPPRRSLSRWRLGPPPSRARRLQFFPCPSAPPRPPRFCRRLPLLGSVAVEESGGGSISALQPASTRRRFRLLPVRNPSLLAWARIRSLLVKTGSPPPVALNASNRFKCFLRPIRFLAGSSAARYGTSLV